MNDITISNLEANDDLTPKNKDDQINDFLSLLQPPPLAKRHTIDNRCKRMSEKIELNPSKRN